MKLKNFQRVIFVNAVNLYNYHEKFRIRLPNLSNEKSNLHLDALYMLFILNTMNI